jgi:hypothetical protein
MSLRFPDRPATTLPELQRDVLMLFYQMGAAAEGVLQRDVEISSAGTVFAHGLRGGSIPRSVIIAPRQATEGPPYMDPDRLPDGKVVYLKAVPTTVIASFVGGIGAGARTFAAALAGDVVERVVNMSTAGDQSGNFEPVVTLAGQIQQTSGSLGVALLAILKRPVVVNCDLVVIP